MFKMYKLFCQQKWNKRWFVLHRTSHEGVVRIEYFDNEESALADQSRRTIPLRDSSRVEKTIGNKVHPYIFQFNSQIGKPATLVQSHHVLAADNQTDMDEWMESIKDAVHEDRIHMRRKKTQSMVVKRHGDEYPSESIGKGYSSKLDSGVYRVTLEENETTEKLNLQGSHNLEITPTHLSLTDAVTGAAIAKWHFKNLKSYGKKSGKFHFEVGKASQTGPGQFMCVTTCSKEIFGIVNNNIKRLRVQADRATMRKQQSETGLRSQTRSTTTNSSFQRPRSRQSTSDIAGEGISGNYRTSKDLDEALHSDPSHLYSVVQKKSMQPSNLSKTDIENHYSIAENDPFSEKSVSDHMQEDPSQLYSTVMKSRKVSSNHEQNKGKADPLVAPMPPRIQSDTSATAGASLVNTQPYYSTPFDIQGQREEVVTTATNRFSYDSTRYSRDSALVNIDASIFDSIGEESTMMSSGIHNPLDNSDTLDFGQLNDNFFDRLDLMDHQPDEQTANDPWLAAGHKSTTSPMNTGSSLPQGEYDRIWDDIQTTTNF